jgi:DNA-binding response OmpR family regulator
VVSRSPIAAEAIVCAGRLVSSAWRPADEPLSPQRNLETAMARILVADDAATVRMLVSRHLRAAGHEVIEAEDGAAAYEAGMKGDIDLAVLDQLMPAMLGTEVIARWRASGVEFPVLVLTAVDDDDTVVRSFELGAADYVRKPFNMSELTARVNGRLPAKE